MKFYQAITFFLCDDPDCVQLHVALHDTAEGPQTAQAYLPYEVFQGFPDMKAELEKKMLARPDAKLRGRVIKPN